MSFRIENILRKDPVTCTSCNNGPNNNHAPTLKDESEGLKSVKREDCSSILHRTLSNRLHPPYYGSVGENNPLNKSSSFHAYGCDRLCYPQSYYNFYFDNDYQPLYSKGRFYPTYSPTTSSLSGSLPTIFPLQYSYYSKRKGGQVRFTANQTDILEKRFLSHKYLSPEDRKILADNLKLSDRQVKTWFQNRRAKWRRSTSSSSIENAGDNTEQNEILKSLASK